ncbi:MAG: SUMF1/EgtB/PvdO family nonheme iron enzyme [Puniceicoccales bacterium]|jgi:formylglycine-generating enzyme required for sulfatase activity|nr:SUMF1/EgtB/PvdO family nonheme iron enzyme [Puniceicoccales bacterium]
MESRLKLTTLLSLPILALSAAIAAPIDIPLVTVGNAGNAANPTTGYGSVSYEYQIGMYEVTSGQYASFLNAIAKNDLYALYNTSMGGGYGCGIVRTGEAGNYSYTSITPNKPVNWVNFWSAARFTNWLTTGDTEHGVYELNGIVNPVNGSVVRNEVAWLAGGFALATEDEWYKAAYYDPTLNGGGYWKYPTQSNTITTDDANYDSAHRDGNTNLTDVGYFSDNPSYYGTFDQAGNLMEWNETIFSDGNNRGLSGGSYGHSSDYIESEAIVSGIPNAIGDFVGFRVVTIVPVPEPSTYAAVFGILALGVAVYRRRK